MRKILGIPEQALGQLKFPALARLLYRDTVRQKHQDRSRLREELNRKGPTTKALPSQAKAKAIADASAPTTPLAEIALKHLTLVSYLHFSSHCHCHSKNWMGDGWQLQLQSTVVLAILLVVVGL